MEEKIEAKGLKAYTLTNQNGLSAKIMNFGGKIISINAPDRNGVIGDVVLGYDEVTEYIEGNPYFGALIGRFGNRIASGRFSIDGIAYQLNINNKTNALHGGPKGFHNKLWDAKATRIEQGDQLKLCLESPDGEEGFPGLLKVKVTYTLTDNNELIIDYQATTTKSTIVNLTNHAFFNLAGEGNGDILNHEIKINAHGFVPVNENLIPTGDILPVRGTPLDFIETHRIGERINHPNEQLRRAGGYDHTMVLDKEDQSLSLAATVRDPSSGRVMEVLTTEPGIQFYTSNFLDSSCIGKGGKEYGVRSALCLEAQHFPDSPNHPKFPSTLLRPGEIYKQRTIYKFGVD